MAATSADEDHDMEDASDLDEENSRGDIQYNESESHLNGQDETAAESSTPTDYSLYDVHPRLAILRQQLHDLEHPIELAKVDFETILPFMDNVWRKLKTSDQTEAAQNTDLYWCKLRKATGQKAHQPRPTPEGKQARKRKPKEEKTCNMAMKVTYSSGAVDKVIVSRVVAGEKHTHDLDHMDSLKRNGGIMNTARKEAVRGFQPASIWWKMNQEPDKLEAAGGKFMKISDVRNVQYPWRQEHPDVALKAHTGYNAARAGPKGAGQPGLPRQKSSPRNATTEPVQVMASAHQRAAPTHATPYSQSQTSHPPPPPYQHHHAPPHHQQPQHQPAPQQSTDVLSYPPELRNFLIPYLPNLSAPTPLRRPHVTLTWAQSLDGRIASSPGHRTALSGPETKAMTHFLRSAHDAILIGVRTAIADDPGLNCRLSGAGGYGGPQTQWQPRPIIIDPTGRLIIRPEMKILQVAKEGRAKAPWIVVGPNVNLHPVAVQTLKSFGGEYLMINDMDHTGQFSWEGIFQVLLREGIKSIMVEGGGAVLSELLKKRYSGIIDSVIITMAPTFLGNRGVQVSQETEYDAHHAVLQTRLKDTYWQPLGATGDAVLCGRLKQPPKSNGILQGIVEMANADDDPERAKQHPAQHPPPPPSHYQHPSEQHRLPPISHMPPPNHRPPHQGPTSPPSHYPQSTSHAQPPPHEYPNPKEHPRPQYSAQPPPHSHHPSSQQPAPAPQPPSGGQSPYQHSYPPSSQRPATNSPKTTKQSPKSAAAASPSAPHLRR